MGIENQTGHSADLTGFRRYIPEPGSIGWLIILLVALAGGLLASALGSDIRLLVIPFAVIVALLAIVDYKLLFFLMWATIPLSTEMEFGGIGADVPDEALMIVLMGVSLLLFVQKAPKLSMKMFLHPLTLVLLLHFGWIALTAISSTQPVISLKFLIAKMWYIAVFYFLAYYLIRDKEDILKWLKWLLIPILMTVVIILLRHSTTGFSFETHNEHLDPFYRNHVDYALMLGVVLPFVWVFRNRLPGKYTGVAICALLLVAIYFAYTRAAYVGIACAIGGYLLVRLRLTKVFLLAATLFVGVIIAYLSHNNRYIDYAPVYEKTITHYEFDNLLEATYKLQDISTMERVYRWIAGFYMIKEKPVLGFGPGSFYSAYKPYTDQHFVTYVSENEERSGTHNYFLMTAVDQGLPGMVIFIALVVIALLKAQWLYNRIEDGFPRQLLIACTGALYFILFILLLNDMIETDKVGTFFFFCLAMLVALEIRYRRPPAEATHNH